MKNLSIFEPQIEKHYAYIKKTCTSAAPEGIEMEKSEAPSLFGKTIDFPEFKRRWQKVPGVMWKNSNLVE